MASRVWLFVAPIVAIILVVVNVLSYNMFYELFNLVLGGPSAIYAPGTEPAYTTEYSSKEEVYNAARDMNQEIVEEGAVLLKNEDSALPIYTPVSDASVTAKPKVSVFGKNSVNLAFGGSGSGGANTANATDLYAGLEAAGFDLNPALKEFYESTSRSGPVRAANSSNLDDGDTIILSTAETPQSMYDDAVKSSYSEYSDAAIVVITRIGGEGFDLPRLMRGATGYRNEDDHFLQLDANEEDLIAAVCDAGFDKVIILINSGNAMELGFLEEDSPYVTQKGYEIDPSKIDAAIWMGMPGESGTYGIGRILNGQVNPSGHLADTYVTDFKQDPTWENFGDNRITGNLDTGVYGGDQYNFGGDIKQNVYYFVDYEEGVYVGYRYYETRGAEDEAWYNDHVVYPFGYGLSYTTFEWAIEDDSALNGVAIEQGQTYDISVTVTNTGDVAGKEVVQVYAHAPYYEGEIEKSEVVLVGFAKTGLLDPDASETVTITVDPYYFASYDYKDQNGNGNMGYELDAGDYALYIGGNAHDVKFEVPFTVSSDILYQTDPVTGNPVVNRYTDCEDSAFNADTGLETILSRSDWEGTYPVTPTEAERQGTDELLADLKDVSHNNPTDFSTIEMPITEEYADITLRSLLFDENGEFVRDEDGNPYVDYDDERWQAFIEQPSVQDMSDQYDNASYAILAIESVGFPRINCADGPVGWACFMDKTRFYDTVSYCCETLVATTWSEDVAYRFGQMVGDEGIVGNEKGDKTPYSGWYAPGMNIHRSPFGGRNFEYYSEDSFLSGRIGAQQVAGCRSKGVFTFIKHFVANEQETHRSISGDCSWLTEQALREIYLRPFEMAVKEGGSRALMTSFNRIGTRWTGGDYRLCTEILRDEWGFRGTVLCDFNTIPAYMNSRQMAYAGGDLNLATLPVSWCDESSAADVYILQQCFKNTAYTVVNSNAMVGEIIGYNPPLWTTLLTVADCVIAAGLVVWGVLVIIKALRKKDEPAKE